jgi:hypothetical protein
MNKFDKNKKYPCFDPIAQMPFVSHYHCKQVFNPDVHELVIFCYGMPTPDQMADLAVLVHDNLPAELNIIGNDRCEIKGTESGKVWVYSFSHMDVFYNLN